LFSPLTTQDRRKGECDNLFSRPQQAQRQKLYLCKTCADHYPGHLDGALIFIGAIDYDFAVIVVSHGAPISTCRTSYQAQPDYLRLCGKVL
jgi:hypothetical protein